LPHSLDFLDGYLLRVMVQILKAEGVDPSGFYNYYRARVEENRTAFSAYDRTVCDYVKARFDPGNRRIVHAATGLGTLPVALAHSGFTVAGVEYDHHRHRSAGRLRDAIQEISPETATRYTLIPGEYPATVADTPWMTRDTVLIFTNCVSTWSADLAARVLASLDACGDIILEARLFGQQRDTPEERQALLGRLEARGLFATPIPSPGGNYFYHLSRERPPP